MRGGFTTILPLVAVTAMIWPSTLVRSVRPLHSSAPLSRRSFHTLPPLHSTTGISFSPIPAYELKVVQWLKSREILARRSIAHTAFSKIWSAHPDEDWTKLTLERSEELLRLAGDPSPAEWDVSEFFAHTLATLCPWRYAEVQRERKAFFESCLARTMRELRAESDAYRHGTMQMTKNELTRKLTVAMGGKLPSFTEVEDAWQDRHTIPAIEWMEDAI